MKARWKKTSEKKGQQKKNTDEKECGAGNLHMSDTTGHLLPVTKRTQKRRQARSKEAGWKRLLSRTKSHA